jgi:hypothetical protein
MSSLRPDAAPAHSRHSPYHARWTHTAFSGASSVGAGSGAVVALGMLGGEVIVLCSCFVVELDVVVTSS